MRLPAGNRWKHVDDILSGHGLHTVCDEARCPNKAECWGDGTATFMILGDLCTRGCRFCATATAPKGRSVREDEPEVLARAAAEMGLGYVVLTSVDRDDLPDRGSAHFARCIRAVKQKIPGVMVEVLIPDYRGEELASVVSAGPDVIAHNIETVRRLQNIRDPRASYGLSLQTLREASALGSGKIKSSILLGLGETEAELLEAFADLRAAKVGILVLGQYLQPSLRQVPVAEYVSPETFAALRDKALAMGFDTVVAAPLARTSYHAREACGKEEG